MCRSSCVVCSILRVLRGYTSTAARSLYVKGSLRAALSTLLAIEGKSKKEPPCGVCLLSAGAVGSFSINKFRKKKPLGCGTRRPLPPPPARPSPLPLLRPPPRHRAAGAQQPPDVCMRSLCSAEIRRSACTTRRTPEPPKRLPPHRARPRRKGASRGPSPQPSPPPPHRRPTLPPPKPPPADAQPHRAALYNTPPLPPPTSPPSASWPALPTRTSLGPETNLPVPGDASAGHPSGQG